MAEERLLVGPQIKGIGRLSRLIGKPKFNKIFEKCRYQMIKKGHLFLLRHKLIEGLILR